MNTVHSICGLPRGSGLWFPAIEASREEDGRVCPNCHTTNRLKAKFCDECGTALSQQRTLRPEAERRQLTVLFCDVVGSTPLAEQLDPEELRDVIRTYQELCAEVIGYFEGYIAQYLGDGLLVYFGHPFAHEDDACQAVRAGLGIIQAVQDSPRLSQVEVLCPAAVITVPIPRVSY